MMANHRNISQKYSRRDVAKLIATSGMAITLLPSLLSFKEKSMGKRKIPSSGEMLPLIGLGTWQSFDVGNDTEMRKQLSEVLKNMKDLGGAMIDSSPMYGSSEKVVGDLTGASNTQNNFFYATKVWTTGKEVGINQMQSSFRKMKRDKMDLMQIHNLLDLKTHITTLREWKEQEKIRYWGITHYTNSSHETLAKIIVKEKPDFVQFNYSINDRNAERNLLKTAKDNGTAVIINRPYHGGSLFKAVRGKELPEWASEIDIHSWGQYFLKYILSNDAVNCVIPGTSKPKHVIDNMNAGYGRFPDSNERLKMLNYLQSL